MYLIDHEFSRCSFLWFHVKLTVGDIGVNEYARKFDLTFYFSYLQRKIPKTYMGNTLMDVLHLINVYTWTKTNIALNEYIL